MNLLGFWSYVHADDALDLGRISQLARDVVGHYEAIKAESIELFLDRDDVQWGDRWRGKIDLTLSNVAFFIPVITPRFFKSPECRRELQFFLNKVETLGISQLILPILYIDVQELHGEPSDALMQVIKETHWQSWIDIRFEERDSKTYRSAVDALAKELVRRVDAIERIDVIPAVESTETAAGDEEDGTLDRIAEFEVAMPRVSETLNKMTSQMNEITSIMTRGTEDMQAGDAQGKAFAARLTVARRVSRELEDPVEKIMILGQSYASDLAKADAGIKALLLMVEEQAKEGIEPSDAEALRAFLDSIRYLSETTQNSMESVAGMIRASEPLENMSKDMRRPLRKLRNGLTAMLEAQSITDSWVELVNDIDIDGLQLTPAAP